MKYGFIILTIIVVVGNACRKPLPTGNNEVPKFYFFGKINNEQIKLEAGVANIFMHTNQFVDVDTILTLHGNLAHETKLDSGISLQVYFKNSTLGTQVANINNFFQPKIFNSYSRDSSYQVTTNFKEVQYIFTGNDNNVASYYWEMGDGLTSSNKNPRVIYKTEGLKTVALKVKYGNGLEDFLVNTINVSFTDDHDGQILIDRNKPDTLLCTAKGINTVWQLPNGTTFNGNNLTYTLPVTKREYLKVSSMLNGVNYSYQQLLAPKYSGVLVNYNFNIKDSILITTIPGAVNYGTAIVTCNYQGKKYTSYKQTHLLRQNTNKVIEVTQAEPYITNAAGQSTYALTTTLNGYLYNVLNINDSILIQSDRMKVAVGYQ